MYGTNRLYALYVKGKKALIKIKNASLNQCQLISDIGWDRCVSIMHFRSILSRNDEGSKFTQKYNKEYPQP